MSNDCATPRKPMVDEECYKLAEHFLETVPGYIMNDIWTLAAELQRACEDACRDVADRARQEPDGA
jgi:hypothetical protein